MMHKINIRCYLSIAIPFGLRIDMESKRYRVITDGAAWFGPCRWCLPKLWREI